MVLETRSVERTSLLPFALTAYLFHTERITAPSLLQADCKPHYKHGIQLIALRHLLGTPVELKAFVRTV